MSRVAKYPVKLPSGVEAKLDGDQLSVKGGQGTLELTVHPDVKITQEDGQLVFVPSETAKTWAMVGTTRALVQNMVTGASEGFTRSLEINGVGYRAQASGKTLNLTLGFSHPIDYTLPEGVTAETPKNTVIVLKSADKQKLGQVAAEIRAFRPPEPYKGKGVRYSDERVRRKEAKKK
ncbi:50S ribosomal protein L6 [Salinicola sp. V024]|uniref:50S ribosomal protein L6 n=1 Tax=Salinicola TaxID=404432 RepID=UPI00094E1543|nr:50S ribosomal protein L6 [Salinicola sp. MH3R3-1]OLO06551.1 50S ribosomal protein L6 [Salinicola sp. MH3R3-1]